MNRLNEIEARANAATEGPWEASMDRVEHTGDSQYAVAYDVAREEDAEFIAHARTDLPRLLAAVRAVEAVHEPIDALNVRINRIQKVCTGCGTDDGNWQVWPCPTIRAITEALEGEG